MSLINDMLQDLDQQRQKQLQPHAGASYRGRSAKPWVFAVGAFLLVAVILWLVVSLLQSPAIDDSHNEPVPGSESVALPKIAEHTLETAAFTRVEPDKVAEQDNTGETSQAEYTGSSAIEVGAAKSDLDDNKPIPEKADPQLWLDDLLRAEQALAQDRLMLPAHDSAYLYYQRVLAVDPGNSAAEQGLTRIAERYLALAESAGERGRHSPAQGYIERALQINPGHQQALLMQQAGPQQPAVETRIEPSLATEHSASDEKEPEAATLMGTSRVTPSTALREQRTVREAEALIAAGQTAEAIAQLDELIATSNKAQTPLADARNLLLRLYLQTGQAASAEGLVEQSLPQVLQACLSARILLHQGEAATALSVLERVAVGETQDEPCRTLLAGLYQRTGQYEAAESHYRRLLQSFGERGRYWLGLALALDEQQAYAAASTAYRRVLQSNDAAPELAAFAQQRLQQLGY